MPNGKSIWDTLVDAETETSNNVGIGLKEESIWDRLVNKESQQEFNEEDYQEYLRTGRYVSDAQKEASIEANKKMMEMFRTKPEQPIAKTIPEQPIVEAIPQEFNEQSFQSWYKSWAKKLGLDPNPDDSRHFYDYRAAYMAGETPDPDTGHWTSRFKKPGHPNQYVNGIDTITGLPIGETRQIETPVSRFHPLTTPQESTKIPTEVKPEELPSANYPEISTAKRPTFYQAIKDIVSKPFIETPEESIAKSKNIYAISKETGIPFNKVYDNYDNFKRELGSQPSTMEVLGGLTILPITAGMASNPVTTLIGIAGYQTLSEIENGTISIIKNIPYKFGAGKGLKDLLPENANEVTKTTADIMDFIGKGLILRGIYKKAPDIADKFTKDVIKRYKIPEKVYISPQKVANIFRTGEEISPQELDIVKSLNLSGNEYRTAFNRGLNVEIPAEQIVKVVDKPWFAKLKSILKIETYEKITTIQKGVPIKVVTPAGLLSRTDQAILDAQKSIETKPPVIAPAPKITPEPPITPEVTPTTTEEEITTPETMAPPPVPLVETKPTGIETKPIGGGIIVGRRGTEAGIGVYATDSKIQAIKYSTGEGPISLQKKQHEGNVIPFSISKDNKLFPIDDTINNNLFNQLNRIDKFKITWDENWINAPKTNRNLWDSGQESKIGIQGLLEDQGYKGGWYPNYITEDQPQGSKDYAIWDKSIILSPDKGEIKLFRGQKIEPVIEMKPEITYPKVLDKVRKNDRTWNFVQKSPTEYVIQNKTMGELPYSTKEYQSYLKRKAVGAKQAGKYFTIPESRITERGTPHLSALLNSGAKDERSPTGINGELRDLFDGIRISGKGKINALPYDKNTNFAEDKIVYSFAEIMHDLGEYAMPGQGSEREIPFTFSDVLEGAGNEIQILMETKDLPNEEFKKIVEQGGYNTWKQNKELVEKETTYTEWMEDLKQQGVSDADIEQIKASGYDSDVVSRITSTGKVEGEAEGEAEVIAEHREKITRMVSEGKISQDEADQVIKIIDEEESKLKKPEEELPVEGKPVVEEKVTEKEEPVYTPSEEIRKRADEQYAGWKGKPKLPLSKNVRSNVYHKISMALIKDEKSSVEKGETLPEETIKMIRVDTNTIVNMISDEYASKKNAGALWLDKKLKDPDWLGKLQEDAWKIQRGEKPEEARYTVLKGWDRTTAMVDTKDSMTKTPIKSGDVVYHNETTGQFILEDTYKKLAEKPAEQLEFMEKVEPLTAETQDIADELLSKGIKLNPDNTLTVYHRTTPENKTIIEQTGKMTGKEDGIFFSTKETGQAEGYGNAIVKLDIPLNKLKLDDIFKDEAHLKLPVKTGAQIDISDYYKQPVIKEVTQETLEDTKQTDMVDELLGQEQMFKNEKGAIRIKPNIPKFEFTDNTAEEGYRRSKGIREPKLVDKLSAGIRNIINKIERTYEHIPKTKEFAQLQFSLLQLQKQKNISIGKTSRYINEIVNDLDFNEYDLFSRKILLDDFEVTSNEGKSLPSWITKDTLPGIKNKVDKAVTNNKRVQLAKNIRDKRWEDLRNEYIAARKSIGDDVSEMLQRKDYFRHQVLDYAQMKSLWGTGKKLKKPAYRGFLQKRKGSTLDINTDYVQAENEVMSQMLYDIQVAKTIKIIDDNYNIQRELVNKAKKKGGTWEDYIPEGYIEWQPREGNVFYLSNTIPESLVKELEISGLESIGITRDDVNKALTVGRARKTFVVKEEVAETLNNLHGQISEDIIAKYHKRMIKDWKIWQLLSPRRFLKYNSRNLTGDAEPTFVGNISTFKKVPEAIKDLWTAYTKNMPLKGNMAEYFDRGGSLSTLQAQEMGYMNKILSLESIKEKKLTDIPKRIFYRYWNTVRMLTDFRENILRYASFLDYTEQIEKSTTGKPNNYGASIPEEIEGLKNKYDKAYWLQNDLLGAYDRIGVAGQSLRAHVFPFWSWQEANFRRYKRLFQNAANNNELALAVGRKFAVKSTFMAIRVGKFFIKASAFLAMVQLYNKLFHKDEEDELPKYVRNTPHIILGRDKDGKIEYFSRIGALGDLLEWFNLDSTPYYINELIGGRMTPKEIAIDMAKAPINKFIQGIEPFSKTTGELLTQRALFPDAFKPKAIRDRWQHITTGLGIENEYNALSGKPSRGYMKTLYGISYYKVDPYEASYNDVISELYRFKKKNGEGGHGFWLSEKSNALYNAKLASKYGDKKAFNKYINIYAKLGGNIKGMEQSLNSMSPLWGLNTVEEQKTFLTWLGEDGEKKMAKAIKFYTDNLLTFTNMINEEINKEK